MKDIVVIDSKGLKMRGVLIAVIVAALIFAWFAVRWQFANLLAKLTPPTDPNAAAVARLAVAWSPADPAGYSLMADAGDDPQTTINAREEAVRLAPNDHRLRTELGRAYEQNDQNDRAEIEFRRAVELAPSYGSTHWYLGNFLLRQERSEEALDELRKSADNNHLYREQVFSLAWDYFDKDPIRIEDLAGVKPEAIANLAYFFAARGRAEESLRNWNKLTEIEKSRRVAVAKAIALGLFDQRHFRQSLEFSKQYGADPDAAPEQISNPSFEKNIGESGDQRFGWQIARNDSKLDISPDNRVVHSGTRSLRMIFKGYGKPSLANLFQTVVVEPGNKYQIRFWVRTENIKSAGPPMLEVLNASDGNPIVTSLTFPDGTSNWQEFNFDFATPADCGAVSIRTVRSFCGENCPITGILWYDDFELIKR
ncbi:MAG: carbohydrate binding domain-containing protein [Pyrinomonadaceae bacterium]